MKKLAILSIVALGMGFSSCDEKEIPAIPENPQDAIFQTSDLDVTVINGPATIDLKSLSDAFETISLDSVKATNVPTDYNVKLVLQISKTEGFNEVFEVPSTIEDNVVKVAPDDLQGVYYEDISKSPKEKTIYARYAAYLINETGGQNTVVRIGGPNYYIGTQTLNVLPFPSDLVIEDAYYLLGTINGWSVANAVKFNHSEASPYDDPVFTLKVDISADDAASGWWWKIVPESTYATGNWVDGLNASYGVADNGDEALSGMLVGRTADTDCGAGCIKEDGPFLITINLEEGTYDFQLAIENLYTPGNSNGWSQTASQKLYTYDYASYMGFAHLNGDFKFSSQPDWGGINYGNSSEGHLSTAPDAGNLSVPTDGLYWLTANIASLTYTTYHVTTIGISGDATEKGWNSSTPLTPSADLLTWSGEVELKGSGEFKFRANDDWAVNLGEGDNALSLDGANIPTPGAGKYQLTLDLSTLPYNYTLVKK